MGVGWTDGFDAAVTDNSLAGTVTFRDPTGGRTVSSNNPTAAMSHRRARPASWPRPPPAGGQ